MPTKSRNYCLTINNPKETLEEISERGKKHGLLTFNGQLEKGAEGTPHYQIFMAFPNPISFNTIRKLYSTAHIEPAKNALRAYEYCSKPDSRVSPEQSLRFGPIPKPSARVSGSTKEFNDACIREGIEALVSDGRVHLREYKKLKEAACLFNLVTAKPTDNTIMDNHWYHGDPGTGKSRSARSTFGDSIFCKPLNKWWDGYDGQRAVLLDDFGRDHKCLGYHLKIWADHYAFTCEIKGATTSIRPRHIIVTSNYIPEDIWDDPQTIKAINRRFKFHHFKKLEGKGGECSRPAESALDADPHSQE